MSAAKPETVSLADVAGDTAIKQETATLVAVFYARAGRGEDTAGLDQE